MCKSPATDLSPCWRRVLQRCVTVAAGHRSGDEDFLRDQSAGEFLAGAPGVEPGMAGPKPAALPLGYAPIARKIGGRERYNEVAGPRQRSLVPARSFAKTGQLVCLRHSCRRGLRPSGPLAISAGPLA